MQKLSFILFYLIPFMLMGQENLVPNPSFEELASYPLGWFHKGKDYSRLMKYWNSPTQASPDIYHPKVRIPIFWTQKGFGIEPPRTGKTMSGITVYGCENGKPHCREYLQIQLLEPLVIGQKYKASFWTTTLQDGKSINNLGIYFSKEEIDEIIVDELNFEPQVNEERIIYAKNGRWQKIEAIFTASETSDFLLVGNFFPDSLTKVREESTPLNYAYYYIDDVSLKKEKPIINVPIAKDDICCLEYEVGKTVRLNNIFFETDRSELLPQSFKELNSLIQVLQEYPDMTIELRGHTDNQGNYKYNVKLSEQRAKAVVDYLTKFGIKSERLQSKGFGDTMPIASNELPEGRQMNRRVEFIVLTK
ncbi:MAG: OmpA family protein [Saprospiraceae bacterium]